MIYLKTLKQLITTVSLKFITALIINKTCNYTITTIGKILRLNIT